MEALAKLYDDPTFERTAVKIIEIWFGSICCRVVKSMFILCDANIHSIQRQSKIPQKEVKYLINYDIITYNKLCDYIFDFKIVI